MDRRSALKTLSYLVLTTSLSPLTFSEKNKLTLKTTLPLTSISTDANIAITKLTNAIIPSQDSLIRTEDIIIGLDHLLTQLNATHQIKKLNTGLNETLEKIMSHHHKNIENISTKEIQTWWNTQLDNIEIIEDIDIQYESDIRKKYIFQEADYPIYYFITEWMRLVLWFYFTTEKVTKARLHYSPVPGQYRGNILISPNIKALANS